MEIDPTGRYLFAMEAGAILIFEIEPNTGGLTYKGRTPISHAAAWVTMHGIFH